MWTKPWTMREGFLIGGGLILAGMMLEVSTGPVMWDAFLWPFNIISLVVFIVILTVMSLMRSRVYAFRFLSTNKATIPALVYAVLLTIVMGLTRQTINGSWVNNMLTFWPFVLIYVYLAAILWMVVMQRLQRLTKGQGNVVSNVSFLLNHLGLFITITTATLGNADMQRLKMVCAVGEPEWRAMSAEQVIELPLAIELKRFIMDVYDDGSPKRFASDVEILTKTGKRLVTTIDVNKPAEVDGWKIYQYGYDQQAGAMSRISILELVSDPWLPVVYVGIYMMLVGAFLLFVMGGRMSKK